LEISKFKRVSLFLITVQKAIIDVAFKEHPETEREESVVFT
jgi:hypothetical protein